MPHIKIDKLIRTKRKSICLQIAHDACLIIRAPLKMPLGTIEKFIYKKHHWIEQKQTIAREKISKTSPKQFISSEKFLYLGEAYPLTILENNYIPLSFDMEFCLSKVFISNAKQIFIRWYKNEAHKEIKKRLAHYSNMSGLKYNKFKISEAKSRWGACTPENNLTFSWRLIMAPLEIIDYVVTHELTHLIEKNHSQRFWNKLSELFPKFKECRSWLKENECLLNLN